MKQNCVKHTTKKIAYTRRGIGEGEGERGEEDYEGIKITHIINRVSSAN